MDDMLDDIDYSAEKELILLKTYECPVCGNEFKQLAVKTGKSRFIKQDLDLRPIHKDIDILKYEVVHCNNCGYASLAGLHGKMAQVHRKMIEEKISHAYKPIAEPCEVITYEDANVRYKLALLNAFARNAKDSEKGLICLKYSWLIKGMLDNLDMLPISQEYSESYLIEREEAFAKDALDCFLKARINETPPLAGMSEVTFDYIVATLSYRFGHYDDASKLVYDILRSASANNSQKEKARNLMELIRDKE